MDTELESFVRKTLLESRGTTKVYHGSENLFDVREYKMSSGTGVLYGWFDFKGAVDFIQERGYVYELDIPSDRIVDLTDTGANEAEFQRVFEVLKTRLRAEGVSLTFDEFVNSVRSGAKVVSSGNAFWEYLDYNPDLHTALMEARIAAVKIYDINDYGESGYALAIFDPSIIQSVKTYKRGFVETSPATDDRPLPITVPRWSQIANDKG